MGSTNEINIIKDEINNLEQYIRRDCIEIRGIPNQGSESVRKTNEIVQRIGEKIGVQVDDRDISISHRLPRRKRPSGYHLRSSSQSNSTESDPIIVKFSNRTVRDEFYHGRRSLRDITTSDLGFPARNKIFIVESLTQRNKEIFNGCLGVKRDKRFKFLWTNMGKIYLRRDENSPRILVQSLNDLDKLAR